MTLTAANLVGYLRAEFAKSGRKRIWLFIVQMLVAVPGAISVVITDVKLTYVLAVSGIALLIIWWLINVSYTRSRDAAQSARRAAVMIGGLGHSLSPAEISNLRDRMTVTPEVAASAEKHDYYASSLPAGPGRLGEMIEESAFYSESLQSLSVSIMLFIIGLFAAALAVIAFIAAPFVENGTIIVVLRIFLAALVFAMSSDVLGACLAHRNAAKSIGDIKARLKVARRDGFPLADVLLITLDYNAAVEGAPESVPFAYKVREKSLNARWHQYQLDNTTSRTSASV